MSLLSNMEDVVFRENPMEASRKQLPVYTENNGYPYASMYASSPTSSIGLGGEGEEKKGWVKSFFEWFNSIVGIDMERERSLCSC
ncbi:hypothetical protein ABW20_dc0104130 [Dactylellina cionopaga]|nr:hypothetical protein ABW20_dc0104130 [Dactylellina cionopaga]